MEGKAGRNDLSRRELMELSDALRREMVEIETYGNYISQTTDPHLKKVLENIQRTHQRHYESLMTHLTGAE